MSNKKGYCDKCRKETNHIITSMEEGVDCYMVVTLECEECGTKTQEKINL